MLSSFSSQHTQITLIVGILVGALMLSLLTIVGLLIVRRRRSRKQREIESSASFNGN
jgi:hypothetical protein